MTEKWTKRLQITVGVIVALVVLGIVAVAGAVSYSLYKSWEIDYRNHQAMVQIIQYNLQQGKLMTLPPPAVGAAPSPAPAATPAPEKK